MATQTTASIDQNGDGQIDPISETGVFEFQLPPGVYAIRSADDPIWRLSYPLGPETLITKTPSGQPGAATGPVADGREGYNRARGTSHDSRYVVSLDARDVVTGIRFGSFNFGDPDEDGVASSIEDAAPNGGDGNNDGIPDRDHSNVTSLPNAADDSYVTIVAPDDVVLVGVSAVENPDPSINVPGIDFPIGFMDYEIHNVPVGGTIDVVLILHNSTLLTHYHKYGPTPGNTTPHLYPFNKSRDYGIQNFRRG